MPRFCANVSLLYAELPLKHRLQSAAKSGFTGFEIQFPYELTVPQWRQLLQESPIRNVLINVAAGDLMSGGEGLAAVPGKQQQFRHAVEQSQRYIEVMKPELVNVLPGRCMNVGLQTEYWKTFVENLHYAAEQFSAMGVVTTFEAINTYDMPGFLVHSTEHMLQVMDELNHSGVKMQYDLYHMDQMGQDLIKDLTGQIERIGHIQFADSPGRGEPGTGKLDLAAYFSLLDDLEYKGWVGAEYHPGCVTQDTLGWLQSRHN